MSLTYSIPLSIKAASGQGLIEGYASTFDDGPDFHNDIVERGAFSNSLAEHKQRNSRPAMFWAHDQREPLGVWQDVHEDSRGLYAKGKLSLGVQRARDAFELAQDGALAFSIGYQTVKQSERDGANLLQEVKLAEISVCGLAANPNARILSVKSLDGASIRDYEQFLRDTFNLSSREAKRLAAGGWKAYSGEEIDTDEIADFLRVSAFRFKGISL